MIQLKKYFYDNPAKTFIARHQQNIFRNKVARQLSHQLPNSLCINYMHPLKAKQREPDQDETSCSSTTRRSFASTTFQRTFRILPAQSQRGNRSIGEVALNLTAINNRIYSRGNRRRRCRRSRVGSFFDYFREAVRKSAISRR